MLFRSLFSPIQVNKTMIKNRVVMGPMGNLNMCEESGRPNDKTGGFRYESRLRHEIPASGKLPDKREDVAALAQA